MTALQAPPIAHEMWFPHHGFPMDWAFAAQAATISLLLAAVASRDIASSTSPTSSAWA